MRPVLVAVAAALAVAVTAPAARAHTMSDGHLDLVARGDQLVGTLDVAVRDLHDAFGLDPDADRQITWADLVARRAAITRYVTDRLAITTGDGPCSLAAGELGVIDRADGAHVAIALVATCPAAITDVSVDYRLLHELDAQHRGLLHVGDARAIAMDGGGPVAMVVRAGRLPRLAAAIPGGACAFAIAGAALALLLVTLLVRRTSRLPLLAVLGVAALAAAPIGWALHRLVA